MTADTIGQYIDPDALAKAALAVLPEAESGLARDIQRSINESVSLQQQGIDAAREGNKDEARRLFRQVTLLAPDNDQAWLWLAGVAESREERQHALERVLAIDANNEMALKGLQAMGARPAEARPVDKLVRQSPHVVDDDPFGDDDPFAELNNLSDTFAADISGPVRRADQPDLPDGFTASSARPHGSTTGPRAASRSAARMDDDEYDDEYDEAPRPANRLPVLAMLAILSLIVIIALGWLRGLSPLGLAVVALCWALICGAGLWAMVESQRRPAQAQPNRDAGGQTLDMLAETAPRTATRARGATPAPQPRPGARITRKLEETTAMLDASELAGSTLGVVQQPAFAAQGVVAQSPVALAQSQTLANIVKSAHDIDGLKEVVYRIGGAGSGGQEGHYEEIRLILDQVAKQPTLKKNICAIASSFTGDTGKLIFPLTTALATGLVAGQVALILTPLGIATFAVIVAGAGVKIFCGGKGGDD